jgi:hypothetical protein
MVVHIGCNKDMFELFLAFYDDDFSSIFRCRRFNILIVKSRDEHKFRDLKYSSFSVELILKSKLRI